jgi:hypothetical protein
MRGTRSRFIIALAAGLLFGGSHPVAAQDVGSVIASEPAAEVGRAGAWTAATAGTPVRQGDTLRTGRPGRLTVVLSDGSVITLGEGSELVLDEHVIEPQADTVRSAFRLLQGKVRSLVSQYYSGRQGSFEVQTPTALAGVRGTDFVVLHDPGGEVTEVVGVSGTVEVSRADRPQARGVVVTAQEMTSIAAGEAPSTPQKLSDRRFRQYLDGLEFLGLSSAVGLPFTDTVASGSAVPEQDRAASLEAAGPPQASVLGSAPGDSPYTTPDASSLLGQPPPVIQSGSSLGIDL